MSSHDQVHLRGQSVGSAPENGGSTHVGPVHHELDGVDRSPANADNHAPTEAVPHGFSSIGDPLRGQGVGSGDGTSASARDPYTNPQPGDAFVGRRGGRRRVVLRFDRWVPHVSYIRGNRHAVNDTNCTLSDWCRWAETATLVRRAETHDGHPWDAPNWAATPAEVSS